MDNASIDIAGDVRNFIQSHFLLNSSECTIEETSSFMENGIIDSTGILELVTFLQEKYKITVEEDEMQPQNLDSLSSVSNYIRSKLTAS